MRILVVEDEPGIANLLIRLFLNLLHNAVKYTPERGQVTVAAAAVETGVRITVTDTGPGIPAAQAPFVFERFYRGESGRARDGQDHGGAGLGLAIAYEIVRVHAGSIHVQSPVRDNAGSAFILHLPGGAAGNL